MIDIEVYKQLEDRHEQIKKELRDFELQNESLAQIQHELNKKCSFLEEQIQELTSEVNDLRKEVMIHAPVWC